MHEILKGTEHGMRVSKQTYSIRTDALDFIISISQHKSHNPFHYLTTNICQCKDYDYVHSVNIFRALNGLPTDILIIL